MRTGRLRVGIDYRSVVVPGLTGIGRYTLNLTRALARLDDPGLEIVLYANRGRGRIVNPEPSPHSRLISYRFPRKLLNLLHPLLSVETFTGALDVFHFTDFSRLPLRPGTTRVATIHDVSFLVYPEFHPPALRTSLEAMTRRTLQACRLVLTDSESARRDILARLSMDPARVVAAPLAAEERFFEPVPGTGAVRARYGLPDRFVLTVGTIQPRKNHARLVRALARCRAPLPLVVAGMRGWLYGEYEAAVKASRVKVFELGHVRDDDLPALYRLAEVMAYPSLYEGFGLPVVEAMASGTPVVTSNRSSMLEVAGNAAVLVDPEDEAAIADGIDCALRGSDQLRSLGPARARAFSWERCAKETLAAYRAAVNGDGMGA